MLGVHVPRKGPDRAAMCGNRLPPLPSVHGKDRWMLSENCDLNLAWPTLQSAIINYLENNRGSLFASVVEERLPILHIYMLGKRIPESASPHIIICHDSKSVRDSSLKLILKFFKESAVFHVQFLLLPEVPIQLMSPGEEGTSSHQNDAAGSTSNDGLEDRMARERDIQNNTPQWISNLRLRKPSPPSKWRPHLRPSPHLRPAEVQYTVEYRKGRFNNRVNVVGGFICINGEYYGLTVAHGFAKRPNTGSHVPKFYNSDGEEEDEEEGEEDKEDEEDEEDKEDEEDEGYGEADRPIKDYETYDTMIYKMVDGENMDWALVSAEATMVPNAVQDAVSGRTLFIDSVSELPPAGRILVPTKRATLRGFGIGPVLGRGATVSYWAIQLESGSFERGDSGSWVIESNTGRVCGLLVSGIASLGTGYMIPFKSILEDIDRWVRRRDYESSSHEDPTTLANRYLPSVQGQGHSLALDEDGWGY